MVFFKIIWRLTLKGPATALSEDEDYDCTAGRGPRALSPMGNGGVGVGAVSSTPTSECVSCTEPGAFGTVGYCSDVAADER